MKKYQAEIIKIRVFFLKMIQTHIHIYKLYIIYIQIIYMITIILMNRTES